MNVRGVVLASVLTLSVLLAVSGSARAQSTNTVPLVEVSIARLEIVGVTVHLRSTGPTVRRLAPNGGIIEDRSSMDGSTGRVIPTPNARAADEITLSVGEACQIGAHDVWHTLRLVRIDGRRAVFRHTGLRGGRPIDETIVLQSSQ